MIPDLEWIVKQRQIEEWRREAEHDRMVREALRARKALHPQKLNRPDWQKVPVYVYNRSLENLGEQFIRLGTWLQGRCADAQNPFTYKKACTE